MQHCSELFQIICFLLPLQKPGKWCAVHVRIAWEIYLYQQKQAGADKSESKPMPDSLRPPSHLLPGGSLSRPLELPLSAPSSLLSSGRSMFESSPHSLLTPGSHICKCFMIALTHFGAAEIFGMARKIQWPLLVRSANNSQNVSYKF